MKEKIYIFDTTLRDGEQSPGASLTPKEKLEIALQLERLNVDVIEAGFPIASLGDFEAVSLIAKNVKKTIIAALARAKKIDIETAASALKFAKRARIHTFIATSDIHIKYKLKMSREEVLKTAVEAVKYARKFTDDVEFSCEDAARSDVEFMCKVIEEVIKAGATVINIPDTVGYSIPEEFGSLVNHIRNTVPNIDKCILSVHCHNDLGLAVANSISAIINGARQVECTINGIGERAGNASLEEIVMIIKTKKNYELLKNFYTDINTKEIYPTSRLVSNLTGIVVQPNKAIVGKNAFRHEAGIHQDGVLKQRQTYEIISPKDVGVPSSELVLGKHSGRHALEKRLSELGYRINKKLLNKIFIKFKNLADKKKYIFDEDIIAIVNEELGKEKQQLELKYFHISSGSGIIPTATVEIAIISDSKQKLFKEVECGDGPVDAAYKAIDKILLKLLNFKNPPKLVDYQLKAISSGKDAQGEVVVKLEYDGELFTGRGISTDIIEASIKSYISCWNNLLIRKKLTKKIKISL
ncbi:MAG: 2-isopropylmalate synthase [Elusimicrobiota bacterium]|nr:2-isopropylmalate synthase [Endomicrobiia bacterium]MDW8165401.1 2-isopropylmalate synthase [Elusimicrobiota bacterium]